MIVRDAVCVDTEVGTNGNLLLMCEIKIIGGKAGGGSEGGQKWMLKVPCPSQKIFYNLLRDTFSQEFLQNSESLEVGTQKF